MCACACLCVCVCACVCERRCSLSGWLGVCDQFTVHNLRKVELDFITWKLPHLHVSRPKPQQLVSVGGCLTSALCVCVYVCVCVFLGPCSVSELDPINGLVCVCLSLLVSRVLWFGSYSVANHLNHRQLFLGEQVMHGHVNGKHFAVDHSLHGLHLECF